MSTKAPWEPLESYQEFPTFATQADAAKVLAPGALDYVATEDAKNWFDPNADLPGDGKVFFPISGVPWVIYPRAFSGKLNPDETGIVGNLAIKVSEAKKVNIPPTGTGMTNVPATGLVVPVPLKPLAATQKLLRPNPFSPFQVRNTDVPLAGDGDQQSGVILAALGRLEIKINKIMAKFGIT